jgi:hypothetical protein
MLGGACWKCSSGKGRIIFFWGTVLIRRVWLNLKDMSIYMLYYIFHLMVTNWIRITDNARICVKMQIKSTKKQLF